MRKYEASGLERFIKTPIYANYLVNYLYAQ
jgi:hypothetical protein